MVRVVTGLPQGTMDVCAFREGIPTSQKIINTKKKAEKYRVINRVFSERVKDFCILFFLVRVNLRNRFSD